MPENNRNSRRGSSRSRGSSPYAMPSFGRPEARRPEPALPQRYRSQRGQQAVEEQRTSQQKRRERTNSGSRARQASRSVPGVLSQLAGPLAPLVNQVGGETLRGFENNVLDNALPNLGDEIAGLGSGIGSLLEGGRYMDGYREGSQDFLEGQERYKRENPNLRYVSAGAGTVAGALLPAGRVLQGASRAQKATQGALWGGGYGFLGGAADGEGLQERSQNAAIGTALGTSLGYVLPGVADDLVAAAPQAGRFIREILDDQSGSFGLPPRQSGGVSPQDFRNPDLSPVMSRDDWAILTAENPNGMALSAAENAERNARLLKELEEMGIAPVPTTGHYGGNPENSFMLSPITQEQALRLGGRYEQDSILTSRGLLYHDGTITPSNGAQYFDEAPEDFYSVIDTPDGPANFAVNLQWEGDDMARFADDLRTPGDYPDPRGTALGSRQEPAGRGAAQVYNDEGLQARLAELNPSAPAPAPALRSTAIVGNTGRPGAAYVNPSLISTRRPSAANYASQGNPDEELLIQTGQSLRDAPDALAKNMDLLRQEPFMQGAQGTPDELYETAVRRGADNLKYIAEELMPPSLVDSSRGWYNTANGFAEDMANRYGISNDQASGVLAALSPQNHWANNVANAEQLLQLRQGGFDGTGLGQAAAELSEGMANSSRKQNAIAMMGPEEARRIMETPFDELSRTDQRHRIAMLGELNFDRRIPDILPDGTRVPDQHTVSWGSSNEIGAALDILDGKPVGGVLSGGGKVPSFYNNIVDPDAPLPMVTTDTHHAGAFSLFPGGGSDTIVQMGMGRGAGSNSARTGSKGIYGLITDATTLAGQELDMLPREVQSVVWEGVRNLWGGPGVKTRALKQEVADIWRTSATPDEARRRIGILMRPQ